LLQFNHVSLDKPLSNSTIVFVNVSLISSWCCSIWTYVR